MAWSCPNILHEVYPLMYKPEDLDKEALQQSIDEIEASEEQRIAAEEALAAERARASR